METLLAGENGFMKPTCRKSKVPERVHEGATKKAEKADAFAPHNAFGLEDHISLRSEALNL